MKLKGWFILAAVAALGVLDYFAPASKVEVQEAWIIPAIQAAAALYSAYSAKRGMDKAGNQAQLASQWRQEGMQQLTPEAILSALSALFPGISGAKIGKGTAKGSGGNLAAENVLRWLSGQLTNAAYARSQEQSNQGFNAFRSALSQLGGGGGSQAVAQAGALNMANQRNEAARSQAELEEQVRQMGLQGFQQMLAQAMGLQQARAATATGSQLPNPQYGLMGAQNFASSINALAENLGKVDWSNIFKSGGGGANTNPNLGPSGSGTPYYPPIDWTANLSSLFGYGGK